MSAATPLRPRRALGIATLFAAAVLVLAACGERGDDERPPTPGEPAVAKVDGKTVSRWAAGNSFFGVTPLRHVVPHVALRKGSVIEISGQTNGYDFADLKALEIAPGAPRPPAPPVAVGGVKYSETLLPLVERVPCLDPALMIPPPSRAWPRRRPPTP